jgi:hypothetical protein
MKLVVIVSDYGAAANLGGSPDESARIFEAPPEMADFIAKSRRNQYATVHVVALEMEEGE